MKIKKIIDIKSDEDLTEAINHILERIYDLEDRISVMDDELYALYDFIPGAKSNETN